MLSILLTVCASIIGAILLVVAVLASFMYMVMFSVNDWVDDDNLTGV